MTTYSVTHLRSWGEFASKPYHVASIFPIPKHPKCQIANKYFMMLWY